MYGSYSRGYKSGGFFGGQTVAPADLAPYDDEKVDAFEVGAKLQSPERRMRSSFAAFYYDYQDLQVYTLILRGAITVQNFTNASNARIYGAEARVQLHAGRSPRPVALRRVARCDLPGLRVRRRSGLLGQSPAELAAHQPHGGDPL